MHVRTHARFSHQLTVPTPVSKVVEKQPFLQALVTSHPTPACVHHGDVNAMHNLANFSTLSYP